MAGVARTVSPASFRPHTILGEYCGVTQGSTAPGTIPGRNIHQGLRRKREKKGAMLHVVR